MRARILALLVAGLTVLTALLPARGADPTAPVRWAPGEAVVKFSHSATPAQRAAALASIRGRVEREIARIGYSLVRFPREVPVALALAALRAQPGVASADANAVGHVVAALELPDDACVSSCNGLTQWNVGAVNALGGWRRMAASYPTAASRTGTQPVKIAVLDTRITTTHADFISRGGSRVNGYDSANGGMIDVAGAKEFPTNPTGTWDWHGTFVAGIAGAAINNTASVAGFGMTAQIMPITVVNGDGSAEAFDVADGIAWAVEHGARVVNLSLGFTTDEPVLRAAVADAAAAKVLVVAAAGNHGGSSAFYPAWYPEAMAVTATRDDDLPAPCTNHSVFSAVAAPGDGVVSLDRNGSFRRAPCGTSAATPHVSALAATLFAQEPARDADAVRAIIQQTADDAHADLFGGPDSYFGNGRINMDRALAGSGLPHVRALTTTFVQTSGGVTSAHWSATASTPVSAVEWFLDALGEPGTGTPGVVDGAALSGDVLFSSTPALGAHRLFVRARGADGTWGPASAAALVVDRKAPGVVITEPPLRTYVGVGGLVRVPLTATIVDERSPTATAVLTVYQKAGDVTITAYTSPAMELTLWRQTQFEFDWMPQPTDAGVWTLTLTVTDRGGNVGSASTTVVVV